MDGHSNFYSCSSDGTIVNWTVLESHLVANIIIVIPFTGIARSEVKSGLNIHLWHPLVYKRKESRQNLYEDGLSLIVNLALDKCISMKDGLLQV